MRVDKCSLSPKSGQWLLCDLLKPRHETVTISPKARILKVIAGHSPFGTNSDLSIFSPKQESWIEIQNLIHHCRKCFAAELFRVGRNVQATDPNTLLALVEKLGHYLASEEAWLPLPCSFAFPVDDL
ncbi:hypothetical protein D3C84_741560 [compost metagenome]